MEQQHVVLTGHSTVDRHCTTDINEQGYTYVGTPRELRCLRINRSVPYQLKPGVL